MKRINDLVSTSGLPQTIQRPQFHKPVVSTPRSSKAEVDVAATTGHHGGGGSRVRQEEKRGGSPRDSKENANGRDCLRGDTLPPRNSEQRQQQQQKSFCLSFCRCWARGRASKPNLGVIAALVRLGKTSLTHEPVRENYRQDTKSEKSYVMYVVDPLINHRLKMVLTS